MKKIFNKSLLVLFALITLFTMCLSASAAEKAQKTYFTKQGKDVYEWTFYEDDLNIGSFRKREVYEGNVYNYFDGQVTIKEASSKPSVLTVAVDETEEDYTTLKFKVGKPGVAKYTLSIKDSEGTTRDISFEAHVSKYQNPVKTFKIGKKNYASKLNKKPCCPVNGPLSGKLKVTAKKGWKIKKIRLQQGFIISGIYSALPNVVKNNASVSTDAEQGVEIILYNKKADSYASVCVGRPIYEAVAG